ncbi:response regulator [Ramlibacter terrae]|uniref:histidine kinase n=1 Tax=Ramlibacter terrae TaxID=2732511 RepID=A0ABX6P2L0_9BURK|nr:response regulator [Ramlibacter terrae]
MQLRSDQLVQAEEQLRQAHKMEAIGQLTGGIAHDFNNMLQGIVGALEVIRRLEAGGRTAGIPRFVDMAMSSAQRAAAMTHRLLAFARQQPLAPQQVDLVALVQSLRELVHRTTGESIDVRLALAPDTGRRNATRTSSKARSSTGHQCARRDARRRHAHAADREPHAGAHARRPERHGAGWRVRAHRRGRHGHRHAARGDRAGLRPVLHHQGHRAGHRPRAVDGLRLRAAVGRLRRHRQQAGRGHARVAAAAAQPGEAAELPLVLPVEEMVHGTGQTIVVVEDDEVVRLLTVEALRNMGYVVHEAATGAEGARLLNLLGPVDLLLSDIGLPGGVSGKQLVDAARSMRPDLKVILITGYAQEVLEADLVAQKIALLRKPVLIDVLLRKVQDVIRAG